MAVSGEGPDALRFEVGAAESPSLVAVGTLEGLVVQRIGGANGPGTGRLRAEEDGTQVAWRAPGSSTFGPAIECAGASVLLFDGDDATKFVRVRGYAAYMPGMGQEAQVFIADRWNNEAGGDDVTAGEAAAGDVSTRTVTLRNACGVTLENIKIWLDAAVVDIEISHNGVLWVSPVTEATGIDVADILPNGTGTLHVRRTIGAAAPSDTDVLNIFYAAFNGPG